MFSVLILVCSVSIAPADCGRDNATEVINGPEAGTSTLCEMYGQAYVADSALVPHRADEYVAVRCTQSTIGRTVG